MGALRLLNVNVWLLNIRGLNSSKLEELYNAIEVGKSDLVCLTETHERYCSVDIPEYLNYVTKRRELGDKKGGGLMIQMGKDLKYELLKTESSDLLFVGLSFGSKSIKLVLVYMDVSCEERNKKIRKELNSIIEKYGEDSDLVILGDFNGHVGFLGPQEINKNGKYILDIMENYNLVLLNADDRCKGEVTREENGVISSLDFILVNGRMYSKFLGMDIDEQKDLFSLSDHCLIKMNIEINVKTTSKTVGKQKVEYYDAKLENKDAFMNDFLSRMETESVDMEKFDDMLVLSADSLLKKQYIKKFKENKKIEPVWFTEEMKNNIKLRQHYNRLVRNTSCETDKAVYRGLYRNQKIKTSKLIKEGINEYEIKITNRIKAQKNSKDLWRDINKLRRKEENRIDSNIYNDQGKPVDKHKVKEVIRNFWKGIYQPGDNKICEIWNMEEKQKYIEGTGEERVIIEFPRLVSDEVYAEFRALRGANVQRSAEGQLVDCVSVPIELREHMDMVGRANMTDYIGKMSKVIFGKEDIREQISQLKVGKQPGPDKLKPEIYKWLNQSEYCIEVITNCMNEILETGEPPAKWQKSRTSLIPKKSKPRVNELRPIALTNVSYKLFMSLLKKSLIEHLDRNNKVSVYQSGFTKNRRLEDNILILRYCISETRRSGTPLIVTAIDFTKAFDSIDRQGLIRTMMKYKCDPSLIEVIARLYTGDSTNLFFNEECIGEVEVKSGIRQGCTGSPWLFVMAVNQIIDRIVKTKVGFRKEDKYIPALFYADDGMLLANNIKDAVVLIRTLEEAASEIGLHINRSKCNIIIFNMKNKPKEIENIKVVSTIKYLGVTINDDNNCFKLFKSEKIKFGQKMCNLAYSVIARSCNKLLIGKTFWKSVILPSLLFASSVVPYDKTSVDKFQRCENNVWRNVLGCPGYTPVAAIRGDIGSSSISTRIMKSKLKYTRYVMNSQNELLKKIFLDMFNENRDTFIKEVKLYMSHLNLENLDDMDDISEKDLDGMIREFDSRNWLEDLQSKSTLHVYKNFKLNIKEEYFYDNTYESILLFRARSNTLKLNWRQRFEGGDVECKLCDGGAEEDLEHFLIQCSALSAIRRSFDLEREEVHSLLLFNDRLDADRIKKFVGAMWQERRKMLA